MNKLDQIPHELLPSILRHLNKKNLLACTLINKRFYKAASPLLWRELYIASDEKLDLITTTLATSSSTPGKYVRSLDLATCWSMSDARLETLIQYVPSLEKLRIAAAENISDTGFRHVVSYCPRLTSVYLHCQTIRDESLQLTNISMHALGQHCHQLTHLTLGNMSHLSYGNLWDALHACPLTSIRITPPRLSSADWQPFIQSITLGIHHHYHQMLAELYVYGDAGDDMMTIIHTHGPVWPHLTHFYLDGCTEVTDSMAIAFIRAHPMLQHLSLEGSLYLADHFLDNVVQCLPDLVSLGVNWTPQLTASGICRLIKDYQGKLADRVYCEGCIIYPDDDDFPQDLINGDGYCLAMDDVEHPDVMWFRGDAFT